MSESSILGLQRLTLREQAVDALRGAIVSGELPPGSHVSEVEMATRLQISRGTLREAMRSLQIEGLLTAGPRGRLLVRHMSDRQVRDLFAVRGALEAMAARELTQRDDRGEIVQTLRTAVARLAAAGSGPVEERLTADMDFHREMCRLTGNETLLQAWTALESSIQMSVTNSGIERAVHNMNVDRHLAIVDAIDAGDPLQAGLTVEQHMQHAAEVLTS